MATRLSSNHGTIRRNSGEASLQDNGHPEEQFLRLEKTSFSAVGQRKAPFEQRPAVPGVPLEVSIARLSLAERQDTVGQRDCPVRSLCPQML